MARLSVNLNKVALLRNARRHGVPDLLHFAALTHQAGADGITVHPRPDERHIRRADVLTLAELMKPWRPRFELNIEGYPDQRLLSIVGAARPEQCTFVPDSPEAFTSEAGWRLDASQMTVVTAAVSVVQQLGGRAILFIDPDPEVIRFVRETGADGVEIYTGSYAAAARIGQGAAWLSACAATARMAVDLGLVVNVGHDLDLRNLPPLIAELPMIAEASIGHGLTADALEMGFGAAVAAYRAVLAPRITDLAQRAPNPE